MKSKEKYLSAFLIIILLIGLSFVQNKNTEIQKYGKPKILKKSGYWNLTGAPISIDDAIPSKNWAYTALNYAWCNGSGSWSDPYIIENVTIDGSSAGNGIEIQNSNAFFIIRNCTIYNIDTSAIGILVKSSNDGKLIRNNVSSNSGSGILLDDSRNITLSENVVNDNNEKGIRLYRSFDNIISKNNLSSNVRGIELDGSDDNILIENIVNDNILGYGVYFSNSHDNIFSKNTVKDNIYGLFIIGSNDNLISNNIIDNTVEIGIRLIQSLYNEISGNKINNSKVGTALETSHYNNIFRNKESFCEVGIRLDTGSLNNLSYNELYNNSIGLVFKTDGYNNLIFKNSFKGNNLHAVDNNTNIPNQWDNTLIGNYWDNYSGSDGDNDGIGDSVHPVPGTANRIDNHPIYGDPFIIPSNIHIDDTGISAPTWKWTATRAWTSGVGTSADPYIIENLNIDAMNNGDGILIGNSTVYFIIQKNIIINFSWPNMGINLDNVSNGKLIQNNISNALWVGIYLNLSNNTIIAENNIFDVVTGVKMMYSNNNEIWGNYLSIPSGYGMELANSDFNDIIRNNFSSNNNGLYFYSCSENLISDNYYNDNTNDAIYLMYGEKNVYLNNDIQGNDYGIRLIDTFENIIIGNLISGNHYGVYYEKLLDLDNLANEFLDNDITENDYGVYVEGDQHIISGNSITNSYYWGLKLNANDTLTYLNYFINNPVHVIDNGGNNAWNSINIGNFWDNYTGVDTNDDGIGDTPYVIKLSPLIQDNYPIYSDGDDLAPTIIINNPHGQDLVGRTAPVLNVTIADPNLDESWFTIDGGINNNTFIENASIGQSSWETLWDSLYEGDFIDIRFYANDTLGHLNSNNVTVIKYIGDITAPTITIHNPNESDLVNRTAPIFNVTIKDENLDKMWYTIDGGINNVTFTTNGSMNQVLWEVLWDSLTNGSSIFIRFYANDTFKNLNMEYVTVIKEDELIEEPNTNESIKGYDLLYLLFFIGLISIFLIKKRKRFIQI